jgi:hypothetical protein
MSYNSKIDELLKQFPDAASESETVLLRRLVNGLLTKIEDLEWRNQGIAEWREEWRMMKESRDSWAAKCQWWMDSARIDVDEQHKLYALLDDIPDLLLRDTYYGIHQWAKNIRTERENRKLATILKKI